MKLYKETGTNPLASCLPLLLQMPIFLALFRTLNGPPTATASGSDRQRRPYSLANAQIFGVAISDSFTTLTATSVPRSCRCRWSSLMTITTFTTQRQLMRKNMPESALTGQYAQQQKILLYVLPVVFAVGGIAFPIGVLLYWSTSNLWTMGQQFYVIRNNPTPGTPAFEAKQKRDARSTTAPMPPTVTGTREGGRRGAPSRRRAPSRRSSRAAKRKKQADAAAEACPERSSRSPTTADGDTATKPVRLDERATHERSPSPGHQESDAIEPTIRPVEEYAGGRRRRVDDAEDDERAAATASRQLEAEGDIAADYLEELLDIADLDGDLDMDVEGDRASVSIVGADLECAGRREGEVLEALQELTRLAVYRETGERSRLMLDIGGYRADLRKNLVAWPRRRSTTSGRPARPSSWRR